MDGEDPGGTEGDPRRDRGGQSVGEHDEDAEGDRQQPEGECSRPADQLGRRFRVADSQADRRQGGHVKVSLGVAAGQHADAGGAEAPLGRRRVDKCQRGRCRTRPLPAPVGPGGHRPGEAEGRPRGQGRLQVVRKQGERREAERQDGKGRGGGPARDPVEVIDRGHETERDRGGAPHVEPGLASRERAHPGAADRRERDHRIEADSPCDGDSGPVAECQVVRRGHPGQPGGRHGQAHGETTRAGQGGQEIDSGDGGEQGRHPPRQPRVGRCQIDDKQEGAEPGGRVQEQRCVLSQPLAEAAEAGAVIGDHREDRTRQHRQRSTPGAGTGIGEQ